jgi:hypothetical protein
MKNNDILTPLQDGNGTLNIVSTAPKRMLALKPGTPNIASIAKANSLHYFMHLALPPSLLRCAADSMISGQSHTGERIKSACFGASSCANACIHPLRTEKGMEPKQPYKPKTSPQQPYKPKHSSQQPCKQKT